MKTCEKCPSKITDGIAWYSLRQYGKELCMKCQKINQWKVPKKTVFDRMDEVQNQGQKWGGNKYE